jgi:hypothetical protein
VEYNIYAFGMHFRSKYGGVWCDVISFKKKLLAEPVIDWDW